MGRLKNLADALQELWVSLAIIPNVIFKAINRLLKILADILGRLCGKKKSKRKKYDKCFRLPPGVSRWPDPCIYSQRYLMARGFSVTWDNPDIEITDLTGNVVPSGNLTADTRYIVKARIHNASFDPAVGVQVGCTVRKWGIETDDRTPIELDNDGAPVIKVIHIMPWGSALAEFNWHTPAVQQEHICIEVICSHPADREIENNVGQENTTVVGAQPGSSFKFIIPFYNPQEKDKEFQLFADEFEIPNEKLTLNLRKVGNIKRSKSQAINPSKVILPSEYKEGVMNKSISKNVATYAYEASQGFRENFKDIENPLSRDWKINMNNVAESGPNTWTLKIPSKTTTDLEVEINVPINAVEGEIKTINLSGRDQIGITVGGVTIHVEVK